MEMAMSHQTPDGPTFSRPNPARVRKRKVIGGGLVILLAVLTIYYAPDLFPRHGNQVRLTTMLVHWAIIMVLAGFTVAFVMVPRTLLSNADEALADDEIIARERRKMKLARAMSPALVLLVLLLYYLSSVFPGSVALTYSPAVLVALSLIAAVWLMPTRRAYTQRIQRKRMEEFQKHNLFNIGWTIFFAGLGCFFAMPFLEPTTAKYLSAFFVLVLIQASTVVIYGYGWLRPRSNPARNDEWAQQLRSRAARIGYLSLMIGVGAIYVVDLYAPQFLSLAIRSTLFAGIALPASFYLVLDWRAGG
jgi:hypothetical protein